MPLPSADTAFEFSEGTVFAHSLILECRKGAWDPCTSKYFVQRTQSAEDTLRTFKCVEEELSRNNFLVLLRYLYSGRREHRLEAVPIFLSLKLDWDSNTQFSLQYAYDATLVKRPGPVIVRLPPPPTSSSAAI